MHGSCNCCCVFGIYHDVPLCAALECTLAIISVGRSNRESRQIALLYRCPWSIMVHHPFIWISHDFLKFSSMFQVNYRGLNKMIKMFQVHPRRKGSKMFQAPSSEGRERLRASPKQRADKPTTAVRFGPVCVQRSNCCRSCGLCILLVWVKHGEPQYDTGNRMKMPS